MPLSNRTFFRVRLLLHHLPDCTSKFLQIMTTLMLFTLHSVDCFDLKRSGDNQCSDCGSVQIWLFYFKKFKNIYSEMKKWPKMWEFFKNNLANSEATTKFCLKDPAKSITISSCHIVKAKRYSIFSLNWQIFSINET